jgi:hypothetical protein
MKRLRDEAAADPTRARGARLLRPENSSARKLPSPEMKRRVWARLAEARSAGAAARTGSHVVVWRRSAVVTLFLVLSTATAGAVIGRSVMSRLSTKSVSHDHAALVAQPGTRQRSQRQPAVIDDLPPPLSDTEPPTDTAVPVETRRRASVHATHGADRSALERSVSRSVVDEQAAHQLLVDAMLALRRARDFQRAGALLEQYLTKYPRGALREEAIALAVEAAAARTDFPRRDYWAAVYLKDYPAGRFRGFVEASRADGN